MRFGQFCLHGASTHRTVTPNGLRQARSVFGLGGFFYSEGMMSNLVTVKAINGRHYICEPDGQISRQSDRLGYDTEEYALQSARYINKWRKGTDPDQDHWNGLNKDPAA